MRRGIAAKECYCTNEVFLWPSIVYQPFSLARGLWHAKVARSVKRAKVVTDAVADATPQAGPSPEVREQGGVTLRDPS